MLRAILNGIVAGGVLVWLVAPATAQSRSGSSGGIGGSSSGGSSGGIGGSSGGIGGSSSGGSSSGIGGSSSSSSSGTNRGGTSGTQTYGTNSPFGPYYGNPIAYGFPSSSGTSQTNSIASQYQRAFPETLSFGQVISSYTPSSTATVNGRPATGTGTATVTTPGFPGVSSSGIRRAPSYISEPVFERAPRPSTEAVRADLQRTIDRSSRLPSRSKITVSMDGSVVVLRGEVNNERERRLAEAILLLTPGVREVRNQLAPAKK